MNSPGAYTLAAINLTTALAAQVQTTINGLDGIAALTLECDFNFGSGGTTCSALVATSLDGGTVWLDIARFDFTTASRKAICNLSGLTSKAVATYVALASEGVLDGVLGPMFRAVITSTGTYANTTIAVRASVR